MMARHSMTGAWASWYSVTVALAAWMLWQSTTSVVGLSGYGLESALNQAESDPLGTIDTFNSLTTPLKGSLLKDASVDTRKKVDSLLGLEHTTVIHVKLVGFPGDSDRSSLHNLESRFYRYIDAVNQEARVGVIASDSHEFLVKSKITVDVVRASPTLTDRIYNVIKSHLDSVSSSRASSTKLFYAPIQAVPYNVVDDIIQDDLEKPLSTYTVYLLNTRPQERSYGYEYGGSSAGATAYYPKCLGTFWAGKDRYLWIDLAAGPVEYGPSTSGEGYVNGEFFPLAKDRNDHQLQNAYLADLAAMVWSAARMLFVPSVQVPVLYEEETEVHIMHIQGANTTDDSKGVDVKIIRKAFEKEYAHLLLPKQKLSFKYFHLKFVECPLCAAAIARALRAFTAPVFLERYTLFVDDYLDSRELHEFLIKFGSDLAEQMKIRVPLPTRVLPVYILDVASERQLLLDRFHQVIPFNDMVIAVRSKAPQAVAEYSCNGRPMVVQTRMLERPVVGAVLQTLWGVAPTHVTWSPPHNDSLVDYRWGLGQTPFGPFSESTEFSFAQRDAAPRNVLYSMLNQSISQGLELLQLIQAHGGERSLFRSKTHREFSQRWALLTYKLERAVSSISLLDHKTALYFLKSLDHELIAIQKLVYTASGDLVAYMKCYVDSPFPWGWLVFSLFLICGVVYLSFRGPKIFVNKKKRF